jgi:protein CrcB
LIPYLWVALGSALGGTARYGFGVAGSRIWGDAFPWSTIAINILGSFVIGFFAALTVPDGALPATANIRTFVMVGICGGFTTFSSFSLQTLSLARDANWFGAMANIVLSVVLCLLAVTVGQAAADRIGATRSQASLMPKGVLAILDHAASARPVLIASALIADRLGKAPVNVLHVRHDAMAGFMPTEEVMTDTRRQEIDGEAARLSTELHRIYQTWRKTRRAGTWQERTGQTERVIADAAANADLVVFGRDQRGSALHTALFDTQRPTLLVPATVPPALGLHVALAWKPGPAIDRAIQASLPLLRRAQRLTILIGSEDAAPTGEPINLPQLLAGSRTDIVTRRFPLSDRTIGEALLAEAHTAGADLLIMGAYTHNRVMETVLGGATRQVLANADLPVLLQS